MIDRLEVTRASSGEEQAVGRSGGQDEQHLAIDPDRPECRPDECRRL
ncbi:MAG: hypothetical protein U0841_29315 [Chloroflexia bacterium]